MATYTPYYNFEKPGLTDLVDILVIDNNYDILDSALHNVESTAYVLPAGGIPDSDIASASTWNAAVADVAKMEVLVVDLGTVSSLPKTESVTGIETDMVCVKAELGTPGAQQSVWTVNTDTADQITLSGTISGSTTVKLYLMKSR